MYLAVSQLPDQPGFNGAEKESACLGFLSGARHVFENPAQLRAAEIGVDQKPCLLTNPVAVSGCLELVAVCRGTAALPHDRIADRNPCLLIPDDRRLPLVGDADGFDIFISTVDLEQRLLRHPHL